MKAYIYWQTKQKLDLYVNSTNDEISGLGTVEIINGHPVITDVHLIKQECGPSHTDLDSDAIAQFMLELMDNGGHPENLKLWWHSHGDMNAFWSGTDHATAEKFGNGWMMSIVLSSKGQYKLRADVYEPFTITKDDIELEVLYPAADEVLKAAVAAEIKEKVSRRAVGCQGWQQGGYGYCSKEKWDTKLKKWIPDVDRLIDGEVRREWDKDVCGWVDQYWSTKEKRWIDIVKIADTRSEIGEGYAEEDYGRHPDPYYLNDIDEDEIPGNHPAVLAEAGRNGGGKNQKDKG